MHMKLGDEAMKHLEHVTYPATKEDLIKACDEMSDVPEADRKWFKENLPEGTYQSAGDVKAALGGM
ncbi:MAG: DUF2795 domain-containing protein [Candidatus Blackburnbacteria bacterium]|nr:DUF2795 domain-containing protein [Candidatus Blackburnbacteria bacterium]